MQTLFMPTATMPPRWDMDVVFPGLGSPEYQAAFDEVTSKIEALETLFDERKIRGREVATIDDETVATFEEVTAQWNALSAQIRTVNAYLTAFVTTDSRDEEALARASEMDPLLSRMRKLGKRFTAWAGSLDTDTLAERSAVAKEHGFNLRKAKVGAAHLMSATEESLVSDMELTGAVSWGKLHGNVTSQLAVDLHGKPTPMSVVRSLAYDPDRDVRRDAYFAELNAWKTVEVPLAAAMNAIKGEVGLLSRRRGWASPLDESLETANIDRVTLDAMMGAAKAAFPIFRRYLHAKARGLGQERLAFYDLFAPIGEDSREWTYEEAAAFVERSFGSYSPKMGDFAARSFRENWTDAEPRDGKRDGAFCMSLRGDESRILMNFKPSFNSVSTLAHELGHAYHNLCLANRTPLQRQTPMTLAETASIFCETIIRQDVLATGTPAEKLAVLEASLQGTTQVVVDITSRFLFEQSVFELRAKRELSVRELCDRMLDAQRQTYGDGLDAELLHPYMWAAKPHYYGRSYYNYPYMFGLLFGLGLYAIYEREPEAFRERYDDLLSSTGLADAATLAQRFGIDIRSGAFWEGSLSQIERDVEQFEALIS